MTDFGNEADFGFNDFGTSVIVTVQTSLASSLRVKVLGNQLSLASTLKVVIITQKSLSSILRVKVLDNQKTLSSSLRVKVLDNQKLLSTNLRVKVLGQQEIISTSLRIKVLDNQITQSSALRVRVIDIQKSLPSNLRVTLTYTTDFTPTCGFNIYNLNASSGAHVDKDVDMGVSEGVRTIVGFQSNPYENTYTSDDTHDIIYDVSSASGTANYYHAPLVNGLTGDHEKTFGMDQQTWNPVWTDISGTMVVSGDWAGSGAQINISVPNTGTVWSPPTASGSNVYDIPALHFGSVVVVNQPTDWDGDEVHKIHGWCPFQMNVGHAVQVSDMDLASGTHVNNLIKIYGVVDTDYLIDFKVYHASPKEWEWYSGATLDANGTITGHATDIWDFIDNLDVGQQAGAGTYNYTLKLYSASGTYQHPNDPVRIMDIEFIIP